MFRNTILTTTALVLGSIAITAASPVAAEEPKTGFKDCRLATGTQENEDRLFRYRMDDAQRSSEWADGHRKDAAKLRDYAKHYENRGDQAQADWFKKQAEYWEDRADEWENTTNAKVNEAMKILNCHTFSTVPLLPQEANVQSTG